MDATEFERYLIDSFEDVQVTEAFGYKFFFYATERRLPFVTMAFDDSDYDSYSNLSRPGVYRVNIGVSRDSYVHLFGAPPTNETVAALRDEYDFTALDTIMPHPEYASQWWICVLSPVETFGVLEPLLLEAYGIARRRAE